ncbi:MAG: hypothetical protein R2764_16155 [Bacteroidales bacterium]
MLSLPKKQIGDTRYDDQANASIQNRIYLYNDGTLGATWTRAMEDGTWSDRGTGYNYFDGNSWGDYPEIQVEDERTGWPSYSLWGENGEIIFAHGANGLVISSRADKEPATGNIPFTRTCRTRIHDLEQGHHKRRKQHSCSCNGSDSIHRLQWNPLRRIKWCFAVFHVNGWWYLYRRLKMQYSTV